MERVLDGERSVFGPGLKISCRTRLSWVRHQNNSFTTPLKNHANTQCSKIFSTYKVRLTHTTRATYKNKMYAL